MTKRYNLDGYDDAWQTKPLDLTHLREDPAVKAVAEREVESTAEQWVRMDSLAITISLDELPALLEKHNRALEPLLDALPPTGRSAHSRCAPAREPGDTPWEKLPAPAGRKDVGWFDCSYEPAREPIDTACDHKWVSWPVSVPRPTAGRGALWEMCGICRAPRVRPASAPCEHFELREIKRDGADGIAWSIIKCSACGFVLSERGELPD